jgi:hypothetical protein
MSYCGLDEAWNSPLQKQINEIQSKYDTLVNSNKGHIAPPWAANLEPYVADKQSIDNRIPNNVMPPNKLKYYQETNSSLSSESSYDRYKRKKKKKYVKKRKPTHKMPFMYVDDSLTGTLTDTTVDNKMYSKKSSRCSDCKTKEVNCADVDKHISNCSNCQSKYQKKPSSSFDYKDVLLCVMAGALGVMIIDMFLNKK